MFWPYHIVLSWILTLLLCLRQLTFYCRLATSLKTWTVHLRRGNSQQKLTWKKYWRHCWKTLKLKNYFPEPILCQISLFLCNLFGHAFVFWTKKYWNLMLCKCLMSLLTLFLYCHKVTCPIKRIVTNKILTLGLGKTKLGLVAWDI